MAPLWLTTIVVMALVMGCATPRGKDGILLTIPFEGNGGRCVAIDYAPPSPDFHVLVQNVSRRPVTLWQEQYSWGYFALQFEVYESSGVRHLIMKKPVSFYANGPGRFTLAPGEGVVWDVGLTSKYMA
jgi:hypothetical protein